MENHESILNRFVCSCVEILSGNLVGVYLHGSLAMGCFNPNKSDIDLIVVTEREPEAGAKRQLMDRAVELDARGPAKGLEFSVVDRAVCKPFVYPTPFTLHYSRTHLNWYRSDPADYVARMNGTDPDLAAHFTILRHRGRALRGEPIEAVFGEVPRADYFDSIWRDVEAAREDIAGDPVYVTLNLCRVLAFARDGAILSKREGGDWGLQNLPETYLSIVRDALTAYSADIEMETDRDSAESYAEYMLQEIKNRV